MQQAFHNFLRGGSYYRAQKHIRVGLILPELLSDNAEMNSIKNILRNNEYDTHTLLKNTYSEKTKTKYTH
jgi:hypothetical protein